MGFLAGGFDIRGDFGGIEPGDGVKLVLPGDFGDVDAVGGGEGLSQFLLKDASPGGVGAGLEKGPQSASRIAAPERGDGFPEGGGVVTEVVHQGDSAGLGPDLETAPNSSKFRQDGRQLIER